MNMCIFIQITLIKYNPSISKSKSNSKSFNIMILHLHLNFLITRILLLLIPLILHIILILQIIRSPTFIIPRRFRLLLYQLLMFRIFRGSQRSILLQLFLKFINSQFLHKPYQNHPEHNNNK